MKPVIERTMELRSRGLKVGEIAKTLNEEGYTKINGGHIAATNIYNYISTALGQRKIVKKPEVASVRMKPRKKPEMVTLTPIDSRKAIVIVTDISALSDVLKEVASG